MSGYGDKDGRYMPPVYGASSGHIIQKKDNAKDGDKSCDANDSDTGSNKNSETDNVSDTGTSDDDSDTKSNEESDTENPECQFKTWLEVLPSKGGMLLAVLLVEIMTDGLTPNQMNILGNFISSVGSLISYKASRDELDID